MSLLTTRKRKLCFAPSVTRRKFARPFSQPLQDARKHAKSCTLPRYVSRGSTSCPPRSSLSQRTFPHSTAPGASHSSLVRAAFIWRTPPKSASRKNNCRMPSTFMREWSNSFWPLEPQKHELEPRHRRLRKNGQAHREACTGIWL